MRGFPRIRGSLFEDPHGKDYDIVVSMLVSPYAANLPFV